MRLLQELFSTDVGVMSAVVLAVILGMGAFFIRFFLRHMHEDEARQQRRS